jgi:colicin import membrane protein
MSASMFADTPQRTLSEDTRLLEQEMLLEQQQLSMMRQRQEQLKRQAQQVLVVENIKGAVSKGSTATDQPVPPDSARSQAQTHRAEPDAVSQGKVHPKSISFRSLIAPKKHPTLEPPASSGSPDERPTKEGIFKTLMHGAAHTVERLIPHRRSRRSKSPEKRLTIAQKVQEHEDAAKKSADDQHEAAASRNLLPRRTPLASEGVTGGISPRQSAADDKETIDSEKEKEETTQAKEEERLVLAKEKVAWEERIAKDSAEAKFAASQATQAKAKADQEATALVKAFEEEKLTRKKAADKENIAKKSAEANASTAQAAQAKAKADNEEAAAVVQAAEEERLAKERAAEEELQQTKSANMKIEQRRLNNLELLGKIKASDETILEQAMNMQALQRDLDTSLKQADAMKQVHDDCHHRCYSIPCCSIYDGF